MKKNDFNVTVEELETVDALDGWDVAAGVITGYGIVVTIAT